MLRQITLQVRAEAGFKVAARDNGVAMSVLDCKAFNKTGMSLLLDLKGDTRAVGRTIAAIRKSDGVREAVEGERTGESTPLLVVLDRPGICQASGDAAIVCLECPFDSDEDVATWRFIVRKSCDLREVLAKLGTRGIEAKIEDVAPVERRATLTGRQMEIMTTAYANGYFEFPRRTSLTELSKVVGVKPSTLSEILRSAERRIMQNALGVPAGA